jgi:hypothetical protein
LEISGQPHAPNDDTELDIKKNPWPESANELYRPSDRRLSAKLVPTFADRGCHVVSVTDPYGRILGFLDLLNSTILTENKRVHNHRLILYLWINFWRGYENISDLSRSYIQSDRFHYHNCTEQTSRTVPITSTLFGLLRNMDACGIALQIVSVHDIIYIYKNITASLYASGP